MQFPSIYLKVKEALYTVANAIYEVSKVLIYKNPLHPEDEPGLVQQCAKVMSDSPGLVDFVCGHVNSVLPNRQVMFSGGVQITEKL